MRVNCAFKVALVVGATTMPLLALSETNVFETARLPEVFDWKTMPSPVDPNPVRLRIAQCSTVRDLPLLNTIPLPPPKPIPLMVRPRRLMASKALAAMVMPLAPPDTSLADAGVDDADGLGDRHRAVAAGIEHGDLADGERLVVRGLKRPAWGEAVAVVGVVSACCGNEGAGQLRVDRRTGHAEREQDGKRGE